MAVTIILWAAAVVGAALAALVVFMAVFVVAAAVSGVREAVRRNRHEAAARDLLARAFAGAAKDRRRG